MNRSKTGRPRRKLRRGILLLPSVFTVGNLFAGFFSLIASLNGHHDAAAVAIGIAVFLDGVDGWVARRANASSDFGLQLDSLADIISFGVAPAVLVYTWGFTDLGNFGMFSAFFFLTCGAVRLARFNVGAQDLKNFAGLPIPGGAAMVAATVHFFGEPIASRYFQFALAAMTYGLALLMISTIRYPSLKKLNLSGEKSHLTVLIVALLVSGIIWFSQQVLLALAIIYVGSGLVSQVLRWTRPRERREEPAADSG